MGGDSVRLTAMAHGGGCGCKLSPAVLRDLLAGVPGMGAFPGLMVGSETADDAAVLRVRDDLAIVATCDFFMPIVDDPYQFGRIAAANALSDVYAMGGVPVLALALLGMPVGKIAPDVVAEILAGGAALCREAGVPVAGGHSIDNPEPLYGLVALGTVHPMRVMRNSGARAGDALVLTKGLGVGVFSAALKRGALDEAGYKAMLDSTTRLNAVGPKLAAMPAVHAMTDVTGFGLLGHLLEVCRGSQVGAALRWEGVPVLRGAEALLRAGFETGAAARNWDSYGAEVRLDDGLPGWARGMLCDPQTSGGLLVSVAEESVDEVLRAAREAGFADAAEIGRVVAGAGVSVAQATLGRDPA